MKAGLSQLLMGAAGGRLIRKRAVGIGVSRALQGEIRRFSRLKSPTSLYRPALSGIGGATVAARLPNGLLGRSQAVRQRILIPPFGGSIPPAPASANTWNSLPKRLCSRAVFYAHLEMESARHFETLCCFRFIGC
jgi:hypothetical protein